MEQLVSTEPNRPLSAIEVQELHRRLQAARDEGIDPDPADVAAAGKINADPLAGFDRSWAPDER
jgi:hypothetical protein